MPNNFALLALIAWPLIGVLIFRTFKDREQAIIASLVWSYLFLPSGVGFDLPAVPPLDKESIPAVFLLLIIILSKKTLKNPVFKGKIIWMLLVLLVLGQFFTVLNNTDPISTLNYVIPGARLRDAISSVSRSVILLIPFLIGFIFLFNKDSHFKLIYTILLTCIFYSVIFLIEIRISPQFHSWVYGFFPHSFAQQFRSGGFRPVGFFGHGLAAAFFVMQCFAIACILLKEKRFSKRLPEVAKIRIHLGLVALYLFVVLILCKSLGSLILGIFLGFCILLLRPKSQVRIAAVLVSVAILFPMLRSNDLVPTSAILSFAGSISEERAESLLVRFTNENDLLARARERPVFGWGGWGRNLIYSEETGRNISIVDGYWIGLIGTVGWVGFLAVFGLLAIPVFMILRKYRGDGDTNLSPITSGICLLLAVNMIELLPNATLFPWTWLFAGALWGHAVHVGEDEFGQASQLSLKATRSRTIL